MEEKKRDEKRNEKRREISPHTKAEGCGGENIKNIWYM